MNIIYIPCSKLVKTFLINCYGPEPIWANRSSDLGILLESFAGKSKEEIYLLPSTQIQNFEYSDSVAIQLPARIFKKTCSITAMTRMNVWVKKRFKVEMFRFAEGMVWGGEVTVVRALETFLKKEGIADKIYSLETAKREWTRYQRRNYQTDQKRA
ncbi:hypothetical protein BKI52_12470 [marine bacterium AO1-C]|nr:hypothetical protein BKI52_12470 [marine bacterium AO1-C]